MIDSILHRSMPPLHFPYVDPQVVLQEQSQTAGFPELAHAQPYTFNASREVPGRVRTGPT